MEIELTPEETSKLIGKFIFPLKNGVNVRIFDLLRECGWLCLVREVFKKYKVSELDSTYKMVIGALLQALIKEELFKIKNEDLKNKFEELSCTHNEESFFFDEELSELLLPYFYENKENEYFEYTPEVIDLFLKLTI